MQASVILSWRNNFVKHYLRPNPDLYGTVLKRLVYFLLMPPITLAQYVLQSVLLNYVSFHT